MHACFVSSDSREVLSRARFSQSPAIKTQEFCTTKTGTPTGARKCKPYPPHDFRNEQANPPRSKRTNPSRHPSPERRMQFHPWPLNPASCPLMVFWNLTHEARIRPFLERTVVKLATFSRPAEKGDVTMNAIFGTWNRVVEQCAKIPKFPDAVPFRNEPSKQAHQNSKIGAPIPTKHLSPSNTS